MNSTRLSALIPALVLCFATTALAQYRPGQQWKDATGRVIAETDTKGVKIDYEYDGDGRRVFVAGRVIAIEKLDGTVIAYAYDQRGNKVQTRITRTGQKPQIIDHRPRPLPRIAEAPPKPPELEPVRLASISTEDVRRYAAAAVAAAYEHDELGRLTSVTKAEGTTTYEYFPNDDRPLIRSVTLPNGNREEYDKQIALNAAADFAAMTGPMPDPRAQLGQSQNRVLFGGYFFSLATGLYYAKARWYDPETARFTTQDSELGKPDDPPSLHRYTYAHNNPTRYVDPTGHDVEVIVGRPYRRGEEWSPYGHVAIRVRDGSGKNRYDLAYDYGRYGETWGVGKSKGEGILNVQKGSDYIARESRERDNVSYVVKTDEATDRRIMAEFATKTKEGERREDLERRVHHSHGDTYRLKEDYDAAPITGLGRSTCVTMSAQGCAAGTDPKLDRIAGALDELHPKAVEENLEGLFDNQRSSWNPFAKKPTSPFSERRFYPKGQPLKPYVVVQEGHEKEVVEHPELLKKERAERDKAWEEPPKEAPKKSAPKQPQPQEQERPDGQQ